MDGWQTIKEVRTDLSEASRLAKEGAHTTAAACMGHAQRLLESYCNSERGPKHGFEGRDPKRKRKG
ncbi:hypothetical protein ES705_14451 [subsurface metagenome]